MPKLRPYSEKLEKGDSVALDQASAIRFHRWAKKHPAISQSAKSPRRFLTAKEAQALIAKLNIPPSQAKALLKEVLQPIKQT